MLVLVARHVRYAILLLTLQTQYYLFLDPPNSLLQTHYLQNMITALF